MRTRLTHPFSGDYKGSTWNAEGLLCNNAQQQHKKTLKLQQLATTHDFTIIAETHSTPGKERAFNAPHDTTAFWAHKTKASAGVLCLVRNTFLQQFENPQSGTSTRAGT